MHAPTPERRAQREALLHALTQIPTAAGHEERVHAFIERTLAPHAARVDVSRDAAGNWLVLQRRREAGRAPLLFTAHLDHPAFVVTGAPDPRTVEMEFRGGVNDPYFVGSAIEVIAADGSRHPGVVVALDAGATPFKRVRATLTDPAPAVRAGAIARWRFEPAETRDGCIHTDACDDLAAAAAALCVLEELLDDPAAGHVGVLFTVAEEVGFVGAIHAARTHFAPRNAALVCLENSRSFPHDSPIGAGAILRVGDRLSVFSPSLTNRLSQVFAEHQKADPSFRYQRKLMAGGACEATAFAALGYESTCLCLPLGNYHNMVDIDGVAAGAHPGRVGREFISLADFHSLCTMLALAATRLDHASMDPFAPMMDRLYAERAFVIGAAERS
jgi:endoglucanase